MRTPLTVEQVQRRRCVRCGKAPGYATWDVCADGNRLRVLCLRCDVKLNRLVLRWAALPGWREKAARYEKRVSAELED